MRRLSGPHAAARRAAAAVVLLLSLATGTCIGVGSGVVVEPAQAQRVRPTFWGMHDQDWRTPPTVPVGAANLTTSSTYWYQVERAPFIYLLNRVQEQVAAAEKAGAQPMLLLGVTPFFWSTDRLDPDQTDPPDLAAWRRYVRTVASTFGNRLDYQIWPEANVNQNWTGSPAQMARVTAAAAGVIEDLAPRATVVGPAMMLRRGPQRRFMEEFYSQSVDGRRVHTYVDAVALDPFPEQSGAPEDMWRLVLRAKQRLHNLGVRLPVWINEINYGVAGGGEPTTTRLPVERQQAYVVRTYVLSAAARVARTYWLGWFRTDTMAVDMAEKDGTAAPPGRSYAVVRSWLAGSRFQGCGHEGGLWRCTAVKGAERRVVLWRTDGRRTAVRAPRGALRWEDQDGRARRIGGGARVPVDYRPVMVAARR